MLVVMLALGVKMLGNKMQLGILKSLNLPPAALDSSSYLYEFSTALMCRVMLASLPDEELAKTASLISTAVELMVRMWFFADYAATTVTLDHDLEAKRDDLAPDAMDIGAGHYCPQRYVPSCGCITNHHCFQRCVQTATR